MPSVKSEDGRRWLAGETVLLLRHLRFRRLRLATNERRDQMRRIIERPFPSEIAGKSPLSL